MLITVSLLILSMKKMTVKSKIIISILSLIFKITEIYIHLDNLLENK